MADTYDTTIKIGMKADTSGGVATEKQMDRLIRKAKEFEKQTNKSATSAIGAFDRMGQSVNKVRGAIMGLGGVTAIVTGIVQAFKNWRAAAREVQENIDAIKVDAAKESLKQILEAEKDIADAIERGNKARRDAEALEDRRLKIVRDLEDANLRVEEAKEKAAVKDGPDKDLQLKRIDEKYADIRSGRNSARIEEDAKREYDRKTKEAEAAEELAKSLREAAEELRGDARGFLRASSRDAAAAAKASGSDAWWKFWSDGADVAKAKTESSKRKSELASQARDAADANEKQAEEAEARAKTLRAEASMTYGAINVAKTNRVAETIEAGIRTGEISAEQGKRDSQRAADKYTINAAPGRVAEIKGRIAGYQARIAAADANVDQQQLELREASRRLDVFNAGVGTRRTGVARERAALEASVQKEEADVHAAQTAAAGIRSNLGGMIQQLLAELQKIESDTKAAKSRMKFNESER